MVLLTMSDWYALRIIFEYTQAWALLRSNGATPEHLHTEQAEIRPLDHAQLLGHIDHLKYQLQKNRQATADFGKLARTDFFDLLAVVEQQQDGKPVYPNLSVRAAYLLYNVIRQRPFVEGNKRIAALIFLLYLHQNEHLLLSRVGVKFPPTAIVSLCLLVENSAAGQQDHIIQSIAGVIELNPFDPSSLQGF